MTTHRAVVIKTMGDADFAGAIVDGISQKTILLNDDELSKLKAELAQIKAEKRKQDAKAGVRHNADEKRWAETKAELAATYADPPHSRLYWSVVVFWASVWSVIHGIYSYMSAWNREG